MNILNVTYESTNNAYKAKQFIEKIKRYNIIAWDFETAIKYTKEDIEFAKNLIATGKLEKFERIQLESKINATALDHPSHCVITHCSIAISETESYVFILDNTSITKYILNYLVSTSQKQILHNASYDFRFLQYFTNKFPKDYEDTALLAKSLLNHVETYKANVKLKELAGHIYGAWGISADNFDIDHMYDSNVLLYAATDSCATLWLWNYMNTQCDEIDSKLLSE